MQDLSLSLHNVGNTRSHAPLITIQESAEGQHEVSTAVSGDTKLCCQHFAHSFGTIEITALLWEPQIEASC